jgi:tetratricopeptide (TPR) repeat protein
VSREKGEGKRENVERRVILVLAVFLLCLLPSPFSLAAQPPPPRAPSASDRAALERQLVEAVQRQPDSFEARHKLAVFYLRSGKVSAALPHLQRAQALNPTNYEVGYDFARALLETNHLDQARTEVKQWLGRKDAGELHNLLGDIEQQAGNLTAAAEEYQRAAHMDASEEHLFDWGDSLLQLRAYEAATEVFKASIVRQPRSARLHVGLGIALYSRGEYRDAVQAFCDAADLAPADPRPYQFLGEMYGVSPEVGSEVTTRLARFVDTHPKNALAHFHYAMSLWKGSSRALEISDTRRVETLLRRAILLDRAMTRAYFELGVLLADQERYPEAIQHLRRAARMQPDLSQAHYRLSQLYQRTGQKDLAAKELETFRRLTAAAGEGK